MYTVIPGCQKSSGSFLARNIFWKRSCAKNDAFDLDERLTYDITGAIIFRMEAGRPYCAWWVQIPLAYGGPDGKPNEPVEEEVISMVLSTFSRQFGGWTPLGESRGSWKNPELPSDETIEERSFGIEVAVLPEKVEEFKQVVYSIGKTLKQKTMYFNIPEPSAYFMDIDDDSEG